MSLRSGAVQLVIAFLEGFHRWVSPVLGPACRFEPTCSRYAAESISEYGLLRGSWLAVRRLSRCQPWGGAGFDPVPRP